MDSTEHLRLEHATLMAQYEAARREIDATSEASRQVIALTLTVISLFVAALVFIDSQAPVALLILPFFLYGLAWVQLRYILLTRRLSRYIAQVIAPRVRAIVAALSPDPSTTFDHLLSWDGAFHEQARQHRSLLLLPVMGAGYALPLLAAALSVTAYLLISRLGVVGWALLALNAAALIYSAVMGFLVENVKL